jgi:hypothetical protein
MPAASDPTPPTPQLPVTFRPMGVRVAAIAFGVLLVGTVVAIWLAIPDEAQRQFTIAQKGTVIGMGLMAFVVGHALARCRVDAADDGLTVVNGYRSHHLAWQQVVAVTLRPGSPWAVLDLSDGTTRSAMGIQGSDGGRAVRQTRQLRALVDAHAASDPRG